MNNEINLVSTKSTENVLKKEKSLKTVRLTAILSLGIVLFFAVGIFILNSSVPLAAVKQEQATVIQNLSVFNNRYVKYTLLDDRAKNINDLLATRKNYLSSVNEVLSKAPSALSPDVLEINSDAVSLTVSGNSLLPVNDFLNSVVGLSLNKKFVKNVMIKSITVSPKVGKYSLSIGFNIL